MSLNNKLSNKKRIINQLLIIYISIRKIKRNLGRRKFMMVMMEMGDSRRKRRRRRRRRGGRRRRRRGGIEMGRGSMRVWVGRITRVGFRRRVIGVGIGKGRRVLMDRLYH